SSLAGLEYEPSPPQPTPSQQPTGEPPPSIAPRHRTRAHLDPLPLALMILGLVGGSCVGLYARTNEWLSADPQRVVRRWKGTGLKEEEIKKRLFDELYPPARPQEIGRPEKGEQKDDQGKKPDRTIHNNVLFTVYADECQRFRIEDGETLRKDMLTAHDPHVK